MNIAPSSSDHARRTAGPPWNTFGLRVRQFTWTLTLAQRAAVVARPRFYSMPWLQRADQPAPDDLLP